MPHVVEDIKQEHSCITGRGRQVQTHTKKSLVFTSIKINGPAMLLKVYIKK